MGWYANLTPEERRRADKRYRVNIERGISNRIPYSTSGVREHLTKLHDAGMDMSDVSLQCDVHTTRLRALLTGWDHVYHKPVDTILVGTRNKVLATDYAPPVGRGARVSALGARRRFRAMQADGFTYPFLANLMGWHTKQSFTRVHDLASARRSKEYVYFTTHQAIADMYDRNLIKWPQDYPQWNHRPGYAINNAQKHGWAPRGAWDADTIDDPEAFPEWTGECGTPAGYRIHHRDSIPMCEPCKAANYEYNRRYR